MIKDNRFGIIRRIIKLFNNSVEAKENYTLEELQTKRKKQEKMASFAVFDMGTSLQMLNVNGIEACRIIPATNKNKESLIFYCHGGGYTCGGLDFARILGTKLAKHLNTDTFTFAYRLAPEYKFPAQINDAVLMWNYVLSCGYKEEQIIVMGDSAGGNLALELCLHLKKYGKKMPRAMVLFSPWTDMTGESESYDEQKNEDPIVSAQYVKNARKAYVSDDVTDFSDPDISPLFADLSGLPPTLVQAGSAEVLLDDSIELVNKMNRQGVEAYLQVFNGGWHVFQQMPGVMSTVSFMWVKSFMKRFSYENYLQNERIPFSERKTRRVDNVANVFLASHSKQVTRTLRISCSLHEEINPEILQKALNITIEKQPQFQVTIRNGLFWNYIEDTDIKPVVSEEIKRVCPDLYHPGKKGELHYRVTYYKNRINFDLFHALGDGTGAIEFMKGIVCNYLKIRYPEELGDIQLKIMPSKNALMEDSFRENYTGKTEVTNSVLSTGVKAYHQSGGMLPYNQSQFIEVHMPIKKLLEKSKQLGVSLSSYIGAALIMSYFKLMPENKRKEVVAIDMPVNLRNYYESDSARNFFNNVKIIMKYDKDYTIEKIALEYDRILKESLEPEKIKAQMNYYLSLQMKIGIRAVPLFLKTPGLRFMTAMDDKRVTAVLSNLGVITFPEGFDKYINDFSTFCSSRNLFITLASFKDDIVFGITSTYIKNDVIREFLKEFSSQDIPVKLYATEVVK